MPGSSRMAFCCIPVLISGCAVMADADPGLSSKEKAALARQYYWDPRQGAFRSGETALERLMDDTPRRMAMGGEKAEGQISELIPALASVGDARFAEVLSTRAPQVRREVLDAVSSAWSHAGLEYPVTRRMADQEKIPSSAQ